MKSVDEHLQDCLAEIDTLSSLELRLLDAHGCTLSEDVTATWDLPPFTNSSMDGYAVRSDDVIGASPPGTPARSPSRLGSARAS
jgi:molybdopterin molybdotransferase